MTLAARSGRGAARPASSIGSKALVLILAVVLATGFLPVVQPRPAQADAPGFSDNVMFTGLEQPTSFQFSSDGRVFVAEKSGLVKVFDSLSDSTADVVVDLRTQVHNYWDRGLLGLALAPTFPADPYMYVLYAHDAAIGGTAPRWGTPGETSDPCPTPPGPNDDGCVISGRLSRFLVTGNTAGPEQVLIEDWCAQYPSHTIGDLKFGPDGALYVSGGDGASFNFTDYGQVAGNVCNDYPGGTNLAPPDTRGGGLRSQKVITDGVPVSLDGAVLRVDPATGEGLPSNPYASSADPNARRIIAMGFRNPFRFTVRPGTQELYIGDVGANTWEEINFVPDAGDSVADNFGWPCYEGDAPMPSYQALGVTICQDLYNAGTARGPLFKYLHGSEVVPGDGCPRGGGDSTTGVAFNDDSNNYPSEYDGALFFTDLQHQCIWVMFAGLDGNPDPNNAQHFMNAENPVYLTAGPEGDLWYADIGGGTLHRISFGSTSTTECPADQFVAEYFNNQLLTGAPVLARCETAIDNDWGTGAPAPGVNPDHFSARWTATRTFAEGTYDFTATADDGVRVYVDGVPIIDQWGDGPARTFTASTSLTAGSHEIRVDYYDNALAAVAKFSYTSTGGGGNQAPTPTIDSPTIATTWKVGDTIDFAGSATDPEDGDLPVSALTWKVSMLHCPDLCHEHVIQTFSGVAGERIVAPDHDYPSKLQFQLTATDSQGTARTTTTVIDPQTATLRFESVPSGLTLTHGLTQAVTPFERTVVLGSANSVGAATPQTLSGTSYAWASWSDGGTRTHNLTAGPGVTTLTATFTPDGGDPGGGTCAAGEFLAEYFNNMTLSGTPVLSRCEAVINNDWGVGSPGPGVNIDGFSVRWTGSPTFASGEHVFSTTADDGVRVFVDDVSLIDQWHDQGPTTYTASRTMTAGAHPVRMEFYENGVGAVARLSWTNLGDPGDPGDPGDCPVGQFTAEYFNNMTLSGAPVLTRCEAVINNDWGGGSPGPGVNIDGFSVRWTGSHMFASGEHVFSTTADDGVRVAVDGVSLIDQWHDQGPTTYTASRTMTAGAHTVRMEFYEAGGGAVARLSWTNLGDPGDPGDPGDCPVGQFTAEYFNNLTLSGTPVLSRCEVVVDNGWGAGSPGPGVNVDGFSARWITSRAFAAGSYEFTVTADDGVRLFVDGALLIDQWHDQGPTTYTASQTLTAGTHTVRMEYYEAGGGADARLSWTSTGGANLAPTATITAPTSSTTWAAGATISFAGSATDPEDGALPASALSWRVSTLHCPDACHEHLVQTFTGVADGSFVAPAPEESSILQIELTATDSDGAEHSATTVLVPEGQCPIGQFQAEYFNNQTLTGAPVLSRCEAVIDNDWGGSPAPGVNADGFSVRWTSLSVFAAGPHDFTATADDGVRVFVDGVVLIDQWQDQPPTTYTASRTLTAGAHAVRVEFRENGGGAVAKVAWTSPVDPGGGSCLAGQFLAEYFNNQTLTGTAVLSRCETVINNDWGGGSPGPGVNADGFSVRWTGSPTFAAGSHLFSVTADDGVRVFVDGTSLIDQWQDQGPTTYTASRTLTAGAHTVRVEFYEAGGGATAKLSWT